MTLEWKYNDDSVDWNELSALYRAAPLGDKQPMHLQKVFANSMFKCFVYEGSKLVAAGRALADGADCSYICDIAALPSHQGPDGHPKLPHLWPVKLLQAGQGGL